MIGVIFKKISQQIKYLLVVSLVLVAAYVSLGRQFMPAVSNYVDYLEEQIQVSFAIPVSIRSLSGSFQGFNPALDIFGLNIGVADQASAVYFERASIKIDVPQSIWQRRWVLEEFSIHQLELDFHESPEGNWLLSGMNAGRSAAPAALSDLYNIFLGFSDVVLTDVVINLNPIGGVPVRFQQGRASIQNQEDKHYIHVDIYQQGSTEQLVLSVELQGQELSEVDGRLHFSLPHSDYSALLAGRQAGNAVFSQFTGGGELWIELEEGSFRQFTSMAEFDALSFVVGEKTTTLENMTGKLSLFRVGPNDDLQLSVSDVAMQWNELSWQAFNASVYLVPDTSMEFYADKVNLTFLSSLVADSGLLPVELNEQLTAFQPRGELQNVNLHWDFASDDDSGLLLKANLHEVRVDAVLGSPAMTGVNGYVEFDYAPGGQKLTAHAEVESHDFSMQLPNVFVDAWDYGYINTRLNAQMDFSAGIRLKLSSGPIVLESAAVDARAQFSLNLIDVPGREKESELTLLVGAQRIDAEQKHLYLPTGPGIKPKLRNTMEWLNGAILAGDIYNAGVLYRGSTIKDSSDEAKTFQSYYVVDNGQVNFSDVWPNLNKLSALVQTDDNNVDVQVTSAHSLGLDLTAASGTVRRDENDISWLSIEGVAQGATASGLNFMQQAPLGENLKSTFASWQAEGNLSATVQVTLPFTDIGDNTDVRIEIDLKDNTLFIPEYDIQASQLSGPVIYDTRTGVEETTLAANLFGGQSQFTVYSELSQENEDNAGSSENADSTGLAAVYLHAEGVTTPEELILWPRQSEFVRTLLSTMEGDFTYNTTLSLPQAQDLNQRFSSLTRESQLHIKSSLKGVSLALPEPFAKVADDELALDVTMDLGAVSQGVRGSLGDDLLFDFTLADGLIDEGVVYLGDTSISLGTLMMSDTKGLAILGRLEHVSLEEWLGVITVFNSTGPGTSTIDEQIGFVDIGIDVLEVYEQLLPDVNMRLDSDSELQSWMMNLQSNALAGDIRIPFDNREPLAIDLDYLHLPGDEDERAANLRQLAEHQLDPSHNLALIVEPGNSADLAVTSADGLLLVEANDLENVTVMAGGALLLQEDLPAEEPVDSLSAIDPRILPAMDIQVDAFTIAARPFGSWQFNYRPTDFGAQINELNFDFRGLRTATVNTGGAEDDEGIVIPEFNWLFDGVNHQSQFRGVLQAADLADVLKANGFAPSLESSSAEFRADVQWPGSPAFFAASGLSGELSLTIEDGRFLQDSSSPGVLKLISILNLNALVRRLRISDDLTRSGLAYEDITGTVTMTDGVVAIHDQLVIRGPSSVYQITGLVDLGEETIDGEMYVTLPVAGNIPWIGLLTANLPLAVGAFVFDQIFGRQFDSLTSAAYTLKGPWDGLEPEFKQAFGSPNDGVPAASPQ